MNIRQEEDYPHRAVDYRQCRIILTPGNRASVFKALDATDVKWCSGDKPSAYQNSYTQLIINSKGAMTGCNDTCETCVEAQSCSDSRHYRIVSVKCV